MRRIAIPGPAVVRFQPKPFKRVVCYNANGYLPTLGFQTGDLVVGANGSEFENFLDLQKFIKLRSKATLLVQRGQERIEIRTNLSKLESGDDFEPACR
jgi:S1-C subfamily serine protease